MADIRYYDVILKPIVTEEEHERYGREEIHIYGSPGSKQISD